MPSTTEAESWDQAKHHDTESLRCIYCVFGGNNQTRPIKGRGRSFLCALGGVSRETLTQSQQPDSDLLLAGDAEWK